MQASQVRGTRSTNRRKAESSKEGKLCSYANYVCNHRRVEGYIYCLRHILEDKSAPYKQCNYIYAKNGRRCPSAAPRTDRRDGYCMEHSKQMLIAKQKASRKPGMENNPAGILECLSHRGYGKSSDNMKKENVKLESGSDSEVETEPQSVCSVLKLDVDSDAESVDSDKEDPLRHAGVYTEEEVCRIFKNKLVRLQSLYLIQFRRLQSTLRERRRDYLHDVKKEKETLMSIYSQSRESHSEQHIYTKLKALSRYHKKHGTELVLQHQARERRRQLSEGSTPKPSTVPKCIYTEGRVKCGDRTVPMSRYCSKHILQDQSQVLYRECGVATTDDTPCPHPVLGIFDNEMCMYHASVPKIPHSRHDDNLQCLVSDPDHIVHGLDPSLLTGEMKDLGNLVELCTSPDKQSHMEVTDQLEPATPVNEDKQKCLLLQKSDDKNMEDSKTDQT